MVFSFACACCAKVYVRIPDIFYVYRQNPNSVTHSTLSAEKQLQRYVPSFVRCLKALDKFINKQKFFVEHPEFKMMPLNFLAELHMGGEAGLYAKCPPHLLEPLLKKYFANEGYDGAEIVLSYLYFLFNVMRNQLAQTHQAVNSIKQDNPKPNYQLLSPN